MLLGWLSLLMRDMPFDIIKKQATVEGITLACGVDPGCRINFLELGAFGKNFGSSNFLLDYKDCYRVHGQRTATA